MAWGWVLVILALREGRGQVIPPMYRAEYFLSKAVQTLYDETYELRPDEPPPGEPGNEPAEAERQRWKAAHSRRLALKNLAIFYKNNSRALSARCDSLATDGSTLREELDREQARGTPLDTLVSYARQALDDQAGAQVRILDAENERALDEAD